MTIAWTGNVEHTCLGRVEFYEVEGDGEPCLQLSGVSVSLTRLFLFDQNSLILSRRLTRTRPGLCEQFLMEHLAT